MTAATAARATRAAAPPPATQRQRRGTAAFRAAMGVVVVAILFGAFLAPEAGTDAADHLLSGLVPAATGVALAWWFPRVRAGARAAIATVCGTLALAAGLVQATGIAHLPASDALAAVSTSVAGAAMLVLGVATAWRARRLDEALPRRYARRVLVGLAVLLAAYLLVLPVGLAIFATQKPRADVVAANLGRPYERVTLTTYDGLRLAAWYVPSRNGAAVIAFPGREQPVPHARMLAQHGYGVLLLDRRGEGDSEGDYNAFGWDGEADVAAALGYLRGRADVDPDRIGGLGLSVGGELLLQTAAHARGLRAVVSEGAGVRSLAEHLHTPGVGRVQRWFSNWVAQTAALRVLSDAPAPEDLTDLVARIGPRPILLIQAVPGAGGEELNPVYRDAAGPSAELWQVAGSGHTGALAARPEEYERRVVAFFERSLRPRAEAVRRGARARSRARELRRVR
jgi:hypothetical protein